MATQSKKQTKKARPAKKPAATLTPRWLSVETAVEGFEKVAASSKGAKGKWEPQLQEIIRRVNELELNTEGTPLEISEILLEAQQLLALAGEKLEELGLKQATTELDGPTIVKSLAQAELMLERSAVELIGVSVEMERIGGDD